MSDLARKLQLGDRPIRVLNAPEELDLDLPSGAEDAEGVLVFVRNRSDLEANVAPAVAAARADHHAWVAYPKARQLGTDLNRDVLAALLVARRVRPVRQVSIDDTWSALRFRPA